MIKGKPREGTEALVSDEERVAGVTRYEESVVIHSAIKFLNGNYAPVAKTPSLATPALLTLDTKPAKANHH